jgi:hypothetical protein
VIEAECAVPESLCHVGDSVFAHDVEGEAAGAGHDAGVIADATFVLVEGHVSNIVVAVFDAPMPADGCGPSGCREICCGRDVEGDLPAFGPQAGCGRAQQGAAGDADDGLDVRMPLGRGQGLACGKDFDGAVLGSRPGVVARHRSVGWVGAVGNYADHIKQLGLVCLQLDQNVVSGAAGNFKCFFDSAWRPE